MILAGEIKDAKKSSFSSDFQTLIEHSLPLYFLQIIINEFEKRGSRNHYLEHGLADL